MAIYENDGTANYEIGKLYDNDGTTSYQIGKVYDNNGTTNSLLYQDSLTVVDIANDVVNTSWSWNVGNWLTVTKQSNGLRFYRYTYNAIVAAACTTGYDLTPYSKMVVKVVKFNAPNAIAQYGEQYASYVGVSTNTGNLGNQSTRPQTSTLFTKYKQLTGTGTFEVDISSLSGTHYIKLMLCAWGQNEGEIIISDLYFE